MVDESPRFLERTHFLDTTMQAPVPKSLYMFGTVSVASSVCGFGLFEELQLVSRSFNGFQAVQLQAGCFQQAAQSLQVHCENACAVL